MNAIQIWVTALAVSTAIIIAWYVSYPICFSVINIGNSLVANSSSVGVIAKAKSWQSFNLLEWCNLLWGGISVIFTLLWAFVASQQIDPDSEYM